MNAKTPHILKLLLPQLTWEIKTTEKEIFITFDDGPHPDITPKVLDLLDAYNAKATFFCVGHNVEKFKDTYDEVLKRGHQTANHTFNHLNGWKTANQTYFENIQKCGGLVNSKLYRPPYGRIGLTQLTHLKKEYNIVMWSVLSMDYSEKITHAQCLDNVIRNTNKGSIVVFHDSLKASGNMFYALPKFLDHFSKQAFKFVALNDKA